MRGSGDFIWGGGGAANAPPTVRSTCGTFWPKNGSQPHISPRLRCFNRKITQKLCATCITRHLFWLVISPSCCSRQGPPLWNWGNFDHFNPLQTTLNVIWLKKVVPNLPFTYLGKVKKNWQLFPLLFFGESQKYERGGVCRPPPASNRVNFDQVVTSGKYLVSFSRPPPSNNLTTNTWLAFNHQIFLSNQPQDDDAQDDDAGEKILTTFVLCVHN